MSPLGTALIATALSAESYLLFWLLKQTVGLQNLVHRSTDTKGFKPVARLARNQVVPDFSAKVFDRQDHVTALDLYQSSNVLLFMNNEAAELLDSTVFPSAIGGLGAYIDGKIYVIWCGPRGAIRDYVELLKEYETISSTVIFCEDPYSRVAGDFKVEMFPCSFLIDEDRRVQKTGTLTHGSD